MKIALAKDVEDFLAEQVRSGHCNDAAELVNDVLRSLREQENAFHSLGSPGDTINRRAFELSAISPIPTGLCLKLLLGKRVLKTESIREILFAVVRSFRKQSCLHQLKNDFSKILRPENIPLCQSSP